MLDRAIIEAAERRIGHAFRDPRRLVQALTHSSSKSDALPSNERLEFLGDSILGAIVARHLFVANPDWDEGELTRVKSAVVSAASLADASLALGLPEFFLVGKGLANQERFPTSLLANVFEALVAAIYLDGGMEAAERFVLSSLGPTIEEVVHEGLAKNWKSILQQYAHKAYGATPHYRVTREEGPDHGKRFEVSACVGDQEFGRGEGRSKKEAEQRAAESALRRLLGPRADLAAERGAERRGASEAPPPARGARAPTHEAHLTPLDRHAPPLGNPPPAPPADGPPGEDDEPGRANEDDVAGAV
jgi:ribonuclease-3